MFKCAEKDDSNEIYFSQKGVHPDSLRLKDMQKYIFSTEEVYTLPTRPNLNLYSAKAFLWIFGEGKQGRGKFLKVYYIQDASESTWSHVTNIW